MRIVLRFCLLLSLLGFVAWPALVWWTERLPPGIASHPAIPSCTGISDDGHKQAIAGAREQVREMLAERRIPGLSVAVYSKGRVVWSEGFGNADVESRITACPQTSFRIASLSKLITAAAMARLIEKHELDLDAPIQTYVPSFPDKGAKITARELASHRAGIRNYRDDFEAVSARHVDSVAQSLEAFRNDPLVFRPDTDFLYSSYGFVLLSAALEGAARMPFLEIVDREVIEPLGLHETFADGTRPSSLQARDYDYVTPYSPDGRVVPSPPVDLSSKWAAGGFVSTAEDLTKFGSAHIQDQEKRFLAPETIGLLFQPRTRQMGVIGYGLGWMSARDLHLRKAFFHFGAGSGATSFLVVYPRERVVIAILSNLGHAKYPFARLMRIANAFLPDPAPRIWLVYWSLVVISFVLARRWHGARHTEARTQERFRAAHGANGLQPGGE